MREPGGSQRYSSKFELIKILSFPYLVNINMYNKKKQNFQFAIEYKKNLYPAADPYAKLWQKTNINIQESIHNTYLVISTSWNINKELFFLEI